MLSKYNFQFVLLWITTPQNANSPGTRPYYNNPSLILDLKWAVPYKANFMISLRNWHLLWFTSRRKLPKQSYTYVIFWKHRRTEGWNNGWWIFRSRNFSLKTYSTAWLSSEDLGLLMTSVWPILQALLLWQLGTTPRASKQTTLPNKSVLIKLLALDKSYQLSKKSFWFNPVLQKVQFCFHS